MRGTTQEEQLSLLDQFASTPPRETSGPRTANRFEFQKLWALCHLLELHKRDQDYLIIFDFHDDVVVLNSPNLPTQVEFFQVKTKPSGTWTIPALIKVKKGEALSICGKMYGNKLLFPETTKSLHLISDARFSVKLRTNVDTEAIVDELSVQDLESKSLKEICIALQQQHSLPYSPICDVTMCFSFTPLGTTDSTKFVMGELASFLDGIEPDGKFAIPAAFRSILALVTVKNNSEKKPKTKEALLEAKGITRAEFTNVVDNIVKKRQSEKWMEISAALTAEQETYFRIQAYRRAWERYEIDRMDCTNEGLSLFQKNIAKCVGQVQAQTNPKSIRQLLSDVISTYHHAHGTPSLPYDDIYLSAIILAEIS